jgi:cell division protein FtsL
MLSFSDWRLRSQFLFITLAVVLFFSATLTVYNAITTLAENRQNIAEERDATLQEQKDKLWDYENLAYDTIESHYRNAQNPEWLEERYGPDLARTVDMAAVIGGIASRSSPCRCFQNYKWRHRSIQVSGTGHDRSTGWQRENQHDC